MEWHDCGTGATRPEGGSSISPGIPLSGEPQYCYRLISVSYEINLDR
jgi:hypothetical protein